MATFVGARSTDTVVFVRNTTEAINLLTHCLVLRPEHAVLSTIVEHHANMLPWRRLARVELLDAPASPEQLLDDMRRALEDRHRPIGVVAITGASNVTGEVFPLAEIGRLAHEHGALLAVDAAQLAPHRTIDMVAMGIDFLALSGHKMYAPFGGGALIAPSAVLADAEPMLAGGGAVTYVTTDDVQWAQLPGPSRGGQPQRDRRDRARRRVHRARPHRAWDAIGAHERRLLAYLDGQIDDLPHLHRLRLWDGPDVDRLGVSTFTVDGMHHALVASVLSAEYGDRRASRMLLRAPVHHAPARREHRGGAHHPRAAPPRRAPRDPRRDHGHRSASARPSSTSTVSWRRFARSRTRGPQGRVRRGSRTPATTCPSDDQRRFPDLRLPPAARGDGHPVRAAVSSDPRTGSRQLALQRGRIGDGRCADEPPADVGRRQPVDQGTVGEEGHIRGRTPRQHDAAGRRRPVPPRARARVRSSAGSPAMAISRIGPTASSIAAARPATASGARVDDRRQRRDDLHRVLAPPVVTGERVHPAEQLRRDRLTGAHRVVVDGARAHDERLRSPPRCRSSCRRCHDADRRHARSNGARR